MQIIDVLKDNLALSESNDLMDQGRAELAKELLEQIGQLVKIEIGIPDGAGAKHLETICIADEGSVDWDYFEDLAKAQRQVIVTSNVN